MHPGGPTDPRIKAGSSNDPEVHVLEVEHGRLGELKKNKYRILNIDAMQGVRVCPAHTPDDTAESVAAQHNSKLQPPVRLSEACPGYNLYVWLVCIMPRIYSPAGLMQTWISE